MRRFVPLFLLIGACGGPSGSPPTTPTAITFHTGSVLVADVQVDGAWQRLQPSTTTTVTITGDYAVSEVCGSPDQIESITWLRSTRDGSDVALPCRGTFGSVVPVTFDTGGVAATIYAGDAVATVPGAATVYMIPGRYDVVAYPTATAAATVVIQRGVAIGGAGTVRLDLSQPTALGARDVMHGGQPLDGYHWYGSLRVGGTSSQLPTAARPQLVSPSLLTADDEEDVEIVVATGSSRRWQRQVVSDDGAIDTAFPGELASASMSFDGVVHASWDAPDPWTRVDLSAEQTVGATGYRYWLTTAFPGWLDDQGSPTSLDGIDPTTLPGWDPAWSFDGSGPITPGFGISSGDDRRSSGVSLLR